MGAAATLSLLYVRAEGIRAAELDRFRSRLSGLDNAQRDAVEALTKGITAGLLRGPAAVIAGADDSAQRTRLSDAVRELFGIEDQEQPEPTGVGPPAGDGASQ